MARASSKAIMGYLPIDPKHHAAILSLVAPATPAHRMLDPFAGEGAFLEAAAHYWNVTPYANELDGERAQQCLERFGPTQAVRCDVERLLASNNAFSVGWFNPPYDHDSTASGSKRVEFRYLRHAWKWIQDGGLVLWAVYVQHLTEEAVGFLARNSTQVDVWALPGKHLGEYQQIVVAAVKGMPSDPERLYSQIMGQKAQPRLLEIQPEPLYKLPPPRPLSRFVFAPDMMADPGVPGTAGSAATVCGDRTRRRATSGTPRAPAGRWRGGWGAHRHRSLWPCRAAWQDPARRADRAGRGGSRPQRPGTADQEDHPPAQTDDHPHAAGTGWDDGGDGRG
jgi:hypothetical protein